MIFSYRCKSILLKLNYFYSDAENEDNKIESSATRNAGRRSILKRPLG